MWWGKSLMQHSKREMKKMQRISMWVSTIRKRKLKKKTNYLKCSIKIGTETQGGEESNKLCKESNHPNRSNHVIIICILESEYKTKQEVNKVYTRFVFFLIINILRYKKSIETERELKIFVSLFLKKTKKRTMRDKYRKT